MRKDRFTDFDDETRDLVLDFEKTVLQGGLQFYDIDELEIIMDYYFEVGDSQSLHAAVDYAERLYPDSIEVKLRRANCFIADQEVDKAIHMLRGLRRQEPDNTEVAFALGLAYSHAGCSIEAIDQFLFAATDNYNLSLVYYNIAEEYYNLYDYHNAMLYYQKALANDPTDTSALFNYTDTCIQAKAADEALQYLKMALAERPYFKEAWHCLAYVHQSLGQPDLAIDDLEYVIAIDPTYETPYYDLAQIHEDSGNVAQAAATLNRLLHYTSSPADVHLALGSLFLRANNIPAAQQYLRKAQQEDPSSPASLAALAATAYLSGDLSLSRSNANKALAIDPHNPDALLWLAKSSLDDNHEEEADRFFRLMVESPQCTEPHCRYFVDYLFSTQQFDDLVSFAEELLDLYPHDGFYSAYLAAALFLTNRYNRLRHALPDADKELLYHLCPQLWHNPLFVDLLPKP